jgi:peptidyl-prolyl cis-trans isomerase D
MIWQEMMDKYVYEPEYEALGITVTEDELAEQLYGNDPSPIVKSYFSDQQTGQIYQQFSNPDGSLNPAAVRAYVAKLTPEEEGQFAEFERNLTKGLIKEKYLTLLRKGFYVTTAQTKREYADENTKYNFKYVVKKYSEVADSTIKTTDAELRDYYQANQQKFKQRDAVRSIEYVAFDLFPSAQDIEDQRKEMTTVAEEFKAKKPAEDSLYVTAMTSSGMFSKTYMHAGQFPVGTDSAFLKAAAGEVLGPFSTGENLTVYKVLGHKTSIDSVKVRHILIAHKGGERADPTITRTKEQAKAKADSILRVIKRGTKMEDIVEKLTDDPGSKSGNKGDYGWFTEESGFVQEFKDAGFKNKKGETVIVETSFGYHVIQVLDKSSESTKVQVTSIDKAVEPSETTIRDIYNKASEFASQNGNKDAFYKAAKTQNLNVAKAGDVLENAKYISGLDNARDVIRWMYAEKTELGTVSEPFQSGDRYVVAIVTKINEKGTKPFEDVKEICELEVRKQKKAKMFTDELNKFKATSLEQWAANASLTVQPGVNVTFAQPYIQGAGYEGAVVGTLATLTPGKISTPIKGTMGVYVVLLENVTQPQPITDIPGQKARLIQGFASRADGSAMEVLKEMAEIVDNRAKHF